MKELLENQGLCHLVRHISSFLDPKSLGRCRVVCHSWRESIDNDRQWLIYQLDHIQNKEKLFVDVKKEERPTLKLSISRRFPEWDSVIGKFSRKQSIPRLKEFVKHMWIYFKDKPMSFYRNPLSEAAAKSNMEFVELLINSSIDLDIKSQDGLTPLHVACRYGNIEIVQLLIKHTPTFDATSRTGPLSPGVTIFHYAVLNSNTQVPKLILNTFNFENIRTISGSTILHYAASYGQTETINFLIDSRHKFGLNIEDTTNDRTTILHFACRKRDIEIVDLVHNALVGLNSDIDFDTVNEKQATPFHYAICNTTSNVAICLLQRFPDKINEVLPGGKHVLHIACEKGNLDLLKYIFGNPNFDIDFNIVDPDGRTQLHYACRYGQLEVVRFLLEDSNEKGIDIFKKDNFLRTAEDYARLKGHTDIVETLKNKYHSIPNLLEKYYKTLTFFQWLIYLFESLE